MLDFDKSKLDISRIWEPTCNSVPMEKGSDVLDMEPAFFGARSQSDYTC